MTPRHLWRLTAPMRHAVSILLRPGRASNSSQTLVKLHSPLITFPTSFARKPFNGFGGALFTNTWKLRDTLEAEVTLISGRERHSKITRNGALITQGYIDKMGGLWSLGDYGRRLSAIFRAETGTKFHAAGDINLSLGRASVFGFTFKSKDNSTFQFAVGLFRSFPGLSGVIWVDQKSGALLRMEASITETDPTFPRGSYVTATNYGKAPIAGIGTFVLPVTTETKSCYGTSGTCYKNLTSFHDCRKFGATTRIIPDTERTR